MKSRLPSSKAPPCCPHCGVPIHLRNGYYGYFWGCPNYPRCPFTLNYPSGKLSASQQKFLTGLRDIENLCKSYSSKLAKESDEATIQSLLLSFEDEFSISKKALTSYLQKQKYFYMREYISTLAGLVYYSGAKTLCSIGEFTEALRINGIAQGLIHSTDANTEKLHTLDAYIRNKMQHPDFISPPLNKPASDAQSISPRASGNGYIKVAATPHSRSFSKFKYISLCIVILLAFFTHGFGLLGPSTSKQKASPPTKQSIPLKKSPSSTKDTSPIVLPATTGPDSSTKSFQPTLPVNQDIQNPISTTYVGNARTGVFHRSGCRAERRMSESNRIYFDNRDELINRGFRPCLICKP